MANTSKLNLVLPGYNDMADVQALSDNFQKIDNAYRIFTHGTVAPITNVSTSSPLCCSIGDVAWVSFRCVTSEAISGTGWKKLADVTIKPRAITYCAATLYNGSSREYSAAEGRLTTDGYAEIYASEAMGAGSYIYFQFIYRPVG